MNKLTLHSGARTEQIFFEGSPLLAELLFARADSPEHLCGGRGICKKCLVTVKTAENDEPRQVLSCRTRLAGNAEVWLSAGPDWMIEGAENAAARCSSAAGSGPCAANDGPVGAAIDIGSTTLVVQIRNIADGSVLSSAAMPNPQRKISADIMGRIQAAMEGKGTVLQKLVTDAVSALLAEACELAGIPRDRLAAKVITGNTTMLTLLTGEDPSGLSRAPFLMSDAFGRTAECAGLGTAYLPGCLHAFAGADTACAILACGLPEGGETCLLCDIGTNGEIVLKKNGVLYVTSTAAGPAFEGAGIACGCGSVTGAIDHVTVENGALNVHTIGNVPAAGLCGSGLIDAVACGLELGLISETGACEGGNIPLSGSVALYPEDVRTLQLAKAAVQAGIRTLLETTGTGTDEISALYLAGGFGSRLNPVSAGAIGLIPPQLVDRVRTAGNAALTGAALLLTDPSCREKEQQIRALSRYVSLGGNPLFNDHYMESMLFGEE